MRGPNNVGRAVQRDSTLLLYVTPFREQKKSWELLPQTFDQFQTSCNNTQQHATRCGNGCKMLQCCVHLNGVIEEKQRLCTSCTCILHFGTFRGCPSPDNDVNRPFSSSRQPLLQSESKCEVFVMGISSSLHMNEN